ncbi:MULTISPECIES: RNA recognition motif domain-containing protein [Carboxydothermus]|uniref:RNA-binding protein n=2 Tax=Carboxydothermus TaxID=129957 RepID=Q3AF33_CARHZ|nr:MULTISPECIES: RNA-binding protein [Carboxydothermus]ABB14351.1 RNA-binding protein [Carboxydothermus hydrogenoformans Z-2901]NYE57225.1 RNA recognition motif-containing protein [Carboxydothermus ferrireducens DSM 11255]
MTKTLYVGNLPWKIRSEQLQEIASEFGEVIGARVILEKSTGRSRGYGFIEVRDEDAEKFMTGLNGKEVEGRQLVVSEARERNG